MLFAKVYFCNLLLLDEIKSEILRMKNRQLRFEMKELRDQNQIKELNYSFFLIYLFIGKNVNSLQSSFMVYIYIMQSDFAGCSFYGQGTKPQSGLRAPRGVYLPRG